MGPGKEFPHTPDEDAKTKSSWSSLGAGAKKADPSDEIQSCI